ncbi:hypothetical protein AXG93_2121s1120 [Marchantia polymorpha subsp. ruderalis]|uniref:Uncharacterized protein n=1 Tax=Marchantia polymorpha subsp. ruderalis TaxID=1480154 RepID=A0A176WBI2_MARPO|nr:hypothetical protein AXG93_2121s1120 [Marchantia polymorpha subsp. ruderalis]
MVASPTPNYAALKDYDIGSGSSSKTSFQEICRFLDNSDREQQFDYKMLIKAFKYLQKCSLTSSVGHLLDAGVVQMASRTYDKLVQLDYSKREVLSSILELLYLIEDLSESVEGKALCGKYFVDRLLALTTTRVLAVTLHRAAVETLCGIITKSAPNQQRVIDDRVSCLKLFKHCLPNCGDFQLQASLTEVFYRLLKQERNLLDLIGEKSVRDAMEILLQKQKPDLLSEIKEIVFLLNESMGPNRSVYSFLADKILLNGENVAPSEQKLINFGKGHLSFYQTVKFDPS